jgi:4-amino-4-deoxy-L-arabinose transferase-like glycosyltransferase
VPRLYTLISSWTKNHATQPIFLVLLVALFHLAIWGGLSGTVAVGTPDDNFEQLLLSQELRFTYGKHPPWPTWILYASNQLFGASVCATYVLGATCSVATMLLLYVFAQPLVGSMRAALASILLVNIEYLNAGSNYFNHNTVQLPLAMLAIMLFHRALVRMRWPDWAMLGLACGVMLLAKFSAVVLFSAFALYLLWSKRLTQWPILKGLAIATLFSLAVVLPYFLALHGGASPPHAYAAKAIFPSNVDRLQLLKSVWGFASSQLAKVAPALLIFLVLRRMRPAHTNTTEAAAPQGAVVLEPFLTLVGFGPVVLTVLIATLSGAFLLVGWGTTFHVLFTLWLVSAQKLAFDVQQRTLQHAVWISLVVQGVLCALVLTHGGRLPNLNPTPHPVVPAIPAQLADTVGQVWREHCTAPMRFVLSDRRTGAQLVVRFQGMPRVVDVTQPEHADFFSDAMRDAYGAIVVTRASSTTAVPVGTLEELAANAPWHSTAQLLTSDGQLWAYKISVLPPKYGNGCRLVTSPKQEFGS